MSCVWPLPTSSRCFSGCSGIAGRRPMPTITLVRRGWRRAAMRGCRPRRYGADWLGLRRWPGRPRVVSSSACADLPRRARRRRSRKRVAGLGVRWSSGRIRRCRLLRAMLGLGSCAPPASVCCARSSASRTGRWSSAMLAASRSIRQRGKRCRPQCAGRAIAPRRRPLGCWRRSTGSLACWGFPLGSRRSALLPFHGLLSLGVWRWRRATSRWVGGWKMNAS